MLLVRQVARRDGAGSQDARRDAADSAGCSSRRRLALRCGVASRWSRAVSLPAVASRWCFASSLAVAASRWCFAPFLLAVASRWCHRLPRRISTQRLPRSGNFFRTDFRFAPSLPQRFACGPPPIHEGHGRPRSVRKSSRLRWKCLSMDCRCSDIANLSAHLHRLPTPPPYLRRMRLSSGCVRRCWVLDEAVASQGRRCWVLDEAVASQERRC